MRDSTLDGSEAPFPPSRLSVIYDPGCQVCIRSKRWMQWQPTFVDLEFVPSDSPEVARRWPGVPWVGEELVVISDLGEVWVGPAAFIMCLWALEEWREWSYRLSAPTLGAISRVFFASLSKRRHALGRFFDSRCDADHDGRCGLTG